MYKSRILKLMGLLEKIDINSFIITRPENQYYISGFTGEGLTIITSNKSFIITDSRYTEQANNETNDFEIVEIQSGMSPFSTLFEIVNEYKLDNIGYESQSITVKTYYELKKTFKQVNLISTDGLIEELRVIKDSQEISLIKSAQQITDKAFQHILQFIKPGTNELELTAELEYFMKKNGSIKTSFDTIVVSGPRTSLPHGIPSSRKLQVGDFVTIDFGARFSLYCSDMTRTVIIGKPSEKQVLVYNTVLQAQINALNYLKPYSIGKEVDEVARNFINKHGFGDYFGHGLGHGVGLHIHEEPRLSPKSKNQLLPGMVVTVEPGIYIKDFGGVRIEDMVVITESRIDNLTKSEKQLICL